MTTTRSPMRPSTSRSHRAEPALVDELLTRQDPRAVTERARATSPPRPRWHPASRVELQVARLAAEVPYAGHEVRLVRRGRGGRGSGTSTMPWSAVTTIEVSSGTRVDQLRAARRRRTRPRRPTARTGSRGRDRPCRRRPSRGRRAALAWRALRPPRPSPGRRARRAARKRPPRSAAVVRPDPSK